MKGKRHEPRTKNDVGRSEQGWLFGEERDEGTPDRRGNESQPVMGEQGTCATCSSGKPCKLAGFIACRFDHPGKYRAGRLTCQFEPSRYGKA